MSVCPTHETSRLVLRPFCEGDLDAYFEILRTPEVRESLRIPESFSRCDAWTQMASWLGQWHLRGTGQWALEEKATGRLVGRAGTHRPERDDWPGLEVGWALHPDVWGRGYATEAGAFAVDWAFAHHEVDELVSVILPGNSASQAVARRLGFEFREERVLSSFPSEAHGIWHLPRGNQPGPVT